jgi:formate/nitrite transporter FocA (FNT family)
MASFNIADIAVFATIGNRVSGIIVIQFIVHYLVLREAIHLLLF